ncbi:MAG: putative quinol monooxygenase [Acidimicrobiales bacterium]
MTIVIRGTLPVRADKREEAIAAFIAVSESSEAEAGCQAYRFAEDVREANSFIITEHWDDEAALAGHFQTPHMAQFSAVVGDLLAGAPEVLKYEVSSFGPLHG